MEIMSAETPFRKLKDTYLSDMSFGVFSFCFVLLSAIFFFNGSNQYTDKCMFNMIMASQVGCAD